MMPNLSILGLNHKSAPLEIRERFSVLDGDRLQRLEQLAPLAKEIVLLSTCNRSEVIYAPPQQENPIPIVHFFTLPSTVDATQYEDLFYHYHGKEALIHLFRVAGGLDSMVPGETQIFGQVKEAFEFSFLHGYGSQNLQTIYQQTLNVAKAIRSETNIGRGPVSVGSIAVHLAQNIFADLRDKKVLLIGAGEMGELAAEYLSQAGVRTIWIANRNLERANTLADKYAGIAIDFDKFVAIMPDVDIIICSIGNRKGLLTEVMIQQTMRQRLGRPLFIIDLGVPRNVDPAINRLSEVYLYNLDDLQKLIDNNMGERRAEMVKGEQIAAQKAEEFYRYNGVQVGSLIISLQERVAGIKQKELEKLFNRLPALTCAEKELIEHSVNQINNKILHDPIITLRRGITHEAKAEDTGNHLDVVSLFRNFFNL